MLGFLVTFLACTECPVLLANWPRTVMSGVTGPLQYVRCWRSETSVGAVCQHGSWEMCWPSCANTAPGRGVGAF